MKKLIKKTSKKATKPKSSTPNTASALRAPRQKGTPRERPSIMLTGFGNRAQSRQATLPADLATSAIGAKGTDPTCPCGFCTGTNRPLVELDGKVRMVLKASTRDEAQEIADYMLSVGARTLAVVTGNDDVQDDVMVPTPAMRRLLEAVDHHAVTTRQPFSDVADQLIGQLRSDVIYN